MCDKAMLEHKPCSPLHAKIITREAPRIKQSENPTGCATRCYLSKRSGSRSFFVASMGSALKQNFYNIVSKQAM